MEHIKILIITMSWWWTYIFFFGLMFFKCNTLLIKERKEGREGGKEKGLVFLTQYMHGHTTDLRTEVQKRMAEVSIQETNAGECFRS